MIMLPSQYLGHPQFLLEIHKIRSVRLNAAFLIPYLKDDMQLLDCGCGLGSITMGFAEILSKGKVIGIDTENFLLDMARTEAKNRNITNAHFQLGNILKLPFPDNFFDVVYETASLSYLSEYKEIAIKEMLRVLKPGGIIAVRELDFGTMIFFPESPMMLKALDIRNKMLTRNGYDIHVGRKLRFLFSDAKLQRLMFSASSLIASDNNMLKIAATYLSSEMKYSIFVEQLVKDGIATLADIDSFGGEWFKFAEQPGAYLQYTWSEVIGYK